VGLGLPAAGLVLVVVLMLMLLGVIVLWYR
jgi:hypothetical protein